MELINAAVPIGRNADLDPERWPRGPPDEVKRRPRNPPRNRPFDPVAEGNERRVCASANITVRNRDGTG